MYFGHFLGFAGYVGHSRGLSIFWSFLRFQRVFWLFFRFLGYFSNFKAFKRPIKSRLVEVQSFYKVLYTRDVQCLPWKNIWKAEVPIKVGFLTWTAALEKNSFTR